MKKSAYTAPYSEITRWETEDIITTSGEQLNAMDNVVANIGDTNYTEKVSYEALK